MKTSRCSDGFSLVEVMMAMLIMTVGLLGLLQSVMVAYDARTRTVRREQCYKLAAQKLNEEALKPYDNISATYARYTSLHPFVVQKRSTVVGNSKRIMVQVDWQMKGVAQHYEIFTLKTR